MFLTSITKMNDLTEDGDILIQRKMIQFENRDLIYY